MHELSIAMSIVEVVQEEANSLGGVQVEAVHREAGAAVGRGEGGAAVFVRAGVRRDSAARGETGDRGSARLGELPHVPGEAAGAFAAKLCCAECGTPAYQVVAGREIFVTALEVRQDEREDGGQDVSQEVAKG